MQMTGLAPRARNPGKTPVPAAHTQDVLQQGNHLRWRVSRIVEAQHGLLCDACLPQSTAQEVSTEVLGRTHQQAHPLLLQHLQGSEASLKTAVREMQRSKHACCLCEPLWVAGPAAWHTGSGSLLQAICRLVLADP